MASHEGGDALAIRLAERTLDLIDVASPSGGEAALCDLLVAELTELGASIRRIDDSFVTDFGRTPGRPHILLVGHLDTVPAQDNIPGRLDRDGGIVYGLGAADMKGALAVMLEMARSRSKASAPGADVDVDVLFYACEEIGVEHSGLTPLLDAYEDVRSADLAVVMEPTAQTVQLGCIGNLAADVTFHGRSAHSARPWLGDNALHKAIGPGLAGVTDFGVREEVIDGLTFREVASVTTLHGGIAGNVIPDRAVAGVNIRYSPRRSSADAEALLRSLLSDDAEFAIVSNAAGAMPCAANPLLDRLVAAGGLATEPKQAWTDVAQFAARGVDAVNFGPGDPKFAHTRDEQVSAALALAASYEALERFLLGTAA